jgi:hypothetical protein
MRGGNSQEWVFSGLELLPQIVCRAVAENYGCGWRGGETGWIVRTQDMMQVVLRYITERPPASSMVQPVSQKEQATDFPGVIVNRRKGI